MLPYNGLRSTSRQAANSGSKVPSCGNQPAYLRLTTRRADTLDPFIDSPGQHEAAAPATVAGRRFTLPP